MLVVKMLSRKVIERGRALLIGLALAVGACSGSRAQEPASTPAPAPAVPTVPVPIREPHRTLLVRRREVCETGPIKVGILHSLSGTMAPVETSLKEVALMTIDGLNGIGGVIGCPLEPVVVDPESNWPLFAEKARELLEKERVAVIFGCYTSVSRKSIRPVLEELGGLLFYPAQYEGEESSPNIYYTGATPHQQAVPAVEYLLSPRGGMKERFVLLGTDYVFARQTNKVLREFLIRNRIAEADILERYTPFGHVDYRPLVAEIMKFGRGTGAAVVSTLWGESNTAFYAELKRRGVTSKSLPVMALSVGEEELRAAAAEGKLKPFVGHLAAWNYFMSINTPENAQFIRMWEHYVKARSLADGEKRVITDPMEATYIGVLLWAQAVREARSPAVKNVRLMIGGLGMRSPSGFDVRMDATNHHLDKPVFVGRIGSDGQFSIEWSRAPTPNWLL